MRKYLIIKACFVLGLAIVMAVSAEAQCGPGGCAHSSQGFSSGQFQAPGSFSSFQSTSVFQSPSWQSYGWQSSTPALFPPLPAWNGYAVPGRLNYHSRTRVRFR